jgi:guanine deaminase
MSSLKILKGNIAFSVSPDEIKAFTQNYIVIKDGTVKGIYETLPEEYEGTKVKDFGNKLIIPGFVDLHVHAPQFYQRGMGMDMELIEWLDTYTFKQESQFSDLSYAKRVYSHFVDEIVRQGTLYASIFATVHKPASELLFELLSDKGIYAYVGKVNMDRNCPDSLKEETAVSIRETEEIIKKYKDNLKVKPILTPRFVPTCSGEMLEGLGKLAYKYDVPVQSHLSENRNEIKWVLELHADHKNYSSVYQRKGLFGQTPTLMAHCIHLTDEEIEMMHDRNVVAVHCPESNLNLSSGVMPLRKMLNRGVKVGLGSDVGGGHNIAMPKAIVRAIQLSKILKTQNPENQPLTFEEAFYMATKGGGSFFGNVGSFEEGCSFDAIIIDDSNLGDANFTIKERLQRFIYIGDDRNIVKRYVSGKSL